jgi:hypothetical protein
MRETLGCVSAPLDVVFVQTVALGQYSLQGVGGRGYALFIRGNVFVKLVGLASSAELCTIATAVDHFLQAREGSPESIPGPRIAFPQAPSRQVGVGETFEMTVEVPDAGWMTACTNAAVVQLLEVDTVRATFKFYGTAEGTVDIRLVFAHQNTLRTTAVTVSVEVVAEEFENVESG